MLLDVGSRISGFVFALAAKYSRVFGCGCVVRCRGVSILFHRILNLNSRTLWSIQQDGHVALQSFGKT